MPAGRQQVDYTDVRVSFQSFWADGVTIVSDQTQPEGAAATMIGKSVTFSGDDTVALCADGDALIGKLIRVDGSGLCTVQVRGCATLPAGASATVTRGRRAVGALGAASAKGYMRQVVSPGAAYTQTEQVEQGRAGPPIWNIADLNNVVVDFGGV